MLDDDNQKPADQQPAEAPPPPPPPPQGRPIRLVTDGKRIPPPELPQVAIDGACSVPSPEE